MSRRPRMRRLTIDLERRRFGRPVMLGDDAPADGDLRARLVAEWNRSRHGEPGPVAPRPYWRPASVDQLLGARLGR